MAFKPCALYSIDILKKTDYLEIEDRFYFLRRHLMSNRPLALTIISVFGFFSSLISIPVVFLDSTKQLAYWYPHYLAISSLIAFISVLGVWFMKRWSLYLYSGLIAMNQVVFLVLFGFAPILFFSSMIFPAIFIYILFYYYKSMN